MEGSGSIYLTLCFLVSCVYRLSEASPLQTDVVLVNLKQPVDMYESLCVLQGGLCRYVSSCPPGQLTSIKGLCPAQKARGVECCYTGKRARRESQNLCNQNGDFCIPHHLCGELSKNSGGCAETSVCCRKLADLKLCSIKGGTCFNKSVRCGQPFGGTFTDCAPEDKCCLSD